MKDRTIELPSSFERSPNLSRVKVGGLCTGCGACQTLAPDAVSMTTDENGFLRPDQFDKLTDEAEMAVSDVCPGLGQRSRIEGRHNETLWGRYESAWVGHASNPSIRFRASSGGGLSATLVALLKTGAVDAVVQTGASVKLPYANATVISSTVEEITDAAGSRYAPSSPLAELGNLVGKGKKYAFVGKPCDVAALRALSERRPEFNDTFPVLLSFFCAGVPSLNGARHVIEALGADPDDVVGFRYRGNGWPGRAVATLADGSSRSMSYHDSWGGILSNHVQHRCKICADGTGVAADLVFADAWEADERGYPSFEERDGKSLIMVRTTLGQEILDSAVGEGHIDVEPFDIGQLEKIQPGQSRRRQALFARLLALKLFGRPTPKYVGLDIFAAARTGSFAWSARNFLGMARRILMGRIG